MVIVATVASSVRPGISRAAAEFQRAAPDLAAFDRGFRAGQEEFNRKKYLDAARVWTNAAESLPETDEHQENRRAIYEYIAEAYEKALAGGGDDALMREGLSILDAYAEVFAAAHPTDTLPEHVIKTRLVFRIRLAKGAAQRQQQALPPTPPPAPIATSTRVGPPPRPWRGLAIGGGVAVAGGAAMLGVFAAGLAGGKSAESKFDDQANACDLNEPVGKCAEFDAQGKTSNSLAVAGIVAAPLLLGAGIAMLVVSVRRKHSRMALTPTLGPRTAGLTFSGAF